MTSPVKSFFSHAFALPGTGAGPPDIQIPQTIPAQQPTAKAPRRQAQSSFFSGAAAAQQAGPSGGATGKTLIGA